jgi:hypothetical protein
MSSVYQTVLKGREVLLDRDEAAFEKNETFADLWSFSGSVVQIDVQRKRDAKR